jgi:hypothetical protein
LLLHAHGRAAVQPGAPASSTRLQGGEQSQLGDRRIERIEKGCPDQNILILAPTHRQLRCAVKVVNQTLGSLNLEKHPDKTFIGRIERGFDFLGYHFSPGRTNRGREDGCKLYREGISAL